MAIYREKCQVGGHEYYNYFDCASDFVRRRWILSWWRNGGWWLNWATTYYCLGHVSDGWLSRESLNNALSATSAGAT